jgi:hypothetical protein
MAWRSTKVFDPWETGCRDMRLDESATQVSGTDFHAVRCLVCRRMRPAESSGYAAAEWDELPGLLHRYRIRLPQVVVSDTYCEGCAVSYHQLLTYEHPGRKLGGWTSRIPFTT